MKYMFLLNRTMDALPEPRTAEYGHASVEVRPVVTVPRPA